MPARTDLLIWEFATNDAQTLMGPHGTPPSGTPLTGPHLIILWQAAAVDMLAAIHAAHFVGR